MEISLPSPFRTLVLILVTATVLRAQSNYETPYAFGTLAGSPYGGWVDGTGSAARFYGPTSVAVDAAGNVYVAETINQVIRKITPAGVVTTLAGSPGNYGFADGTGSAARFDYPAGIAVDSSGNVYVSCNATIRKITPAGVVTTFVGTANSFGSTDGTGSAARFHTPRGIAIDGAGTIYVVDSSNYTIRKITPAGVVTTLAGSAGLFGSTDGLGSAARFSGPSALAVDSNGNVFVTDGSNGIRKVTPAGIVTTLPAAPSYSGTSYPTGVAADSNGNIYITDRENNLVSKMVAEGAPFPFAGTPSSQGSYPPTNVGSADGTGPAAQFNRPEGVAVDAAGNLFVADSQNHTIRKITPQADVTTFAGKAVKGNWADGSGSSARFYLPHGLTVNASGGIFVGEHNMIRAINPAGYVSTFAGYDGIDRGGSTDGADTEPRLFLPGDIAVDSLGVAYVADMYGNSIRKISVQGMVSTLAGLNDLFNTGSTDGTGSAARFFFPQGVAVDSVGNVFVADSSNHTIRKITAAGVVTTFAGVAGLAGSEDGTGPAVRFTAPTRIAVDGADNLYVADSGNCTIRKITPAGVVTTYAGVAGVRGSTDGAAEDALFNNPSGVAVDASGNVFVADTNNNLIRKISTAGMVTTVAGSAGLVGAVDGIGDSVRFYHPFDVAVDSSGALYVSDTYNHTIRKGGLPAAPAISAQPLGQTLGIGYSITFSVTASGAPLPTYQWRKDGVDIPGATSSTYMIASTALNDSGGYTVAVTNSLGTASSSIAQLSVLAVLLPPSDAVVTFTVE